MKKMIEIDYQQFTAKQNKEEPTKNDDKPSGTVETIDEDPNPFTPVCYGYRRTKKK